ncbi:MAG: Hpt domain-containing protein [Pseudomonadota bacterium]|nr:Hpt domain-containing protein [Pseudomonadota bacterium]
MLTPEEKSMISTDPILADIMPGYIERRRKDISDLHAAFDENDFFRMKSICHQVRGNAITFGFKGLHQICTEIEDALGQQDYSDIKNKISVLDNFKNWLKDHSH